MPHSRPWRLKSLVWEDSDGAFSYSACHEAVVVSVLCLAPSRKSYLLADNLHQHSFHRIMSALRRRHQPLRA